MNAFCRHRQIYRRSKRQVIVCSDLSRVKIRQNQSKHQKKILPFDVYSLIGKLKFISTTSACKNPQP